MTEYGPGQVILERYRVIDVPGVPRRWGDTLRAADQSFGRVVDIVTSPDPLHTPAGALFARRARTVGALRHPLLPMMYDVSYEDEHVAVIMQHVEGRPLLESVARERGSWPAARVLRLVEDLAVVLGPAHDQGVCHGAFSARSVVVDVDGAPALVDLVWPPSPGGSAREGDAPEVRAGQPQSPRADVYALGHLLRQVARAAGAAGRGSLAAGVEDLLECAMAVRPGERYANGAEMAAALRALREGAPAVRPSVVSRLPAARAPLPARPQPRAAVQRVAPRGAGAGLQRAPDALLPVALGAWLALAAGLGLVMHAPHSGGWKAGYMWRHAQGRWAGDRFSHSFQGDRFFYSRVGGF
jgi:hypothetical protein